MKDSKRENPGKASFTIIKEHQAVMRHLHTGDVRHEYEYARDDREQTNDRYLYYWI